MQLPEIKTSYQKLTAFQKAKTLVLLVYQLTRNYPRNEQFSLVSQMRRAAISIIANLAEEYSKGSTKEYIRFLNIAIGSATELKIYLEISLDLDYLKNKDFHKAQNLLIEVFKLLYTYKKILINRSKRIEE